MPVKAGEKLQIKAKDWNAVLELIKKNDIQKTKKNIARLKNTRVKNSTEITIPRFGILRIENTLYETKPETKTRPNTIIPDTIQVSI